MKYLLVVSIHYKNSKFMIQQILYQIHINNSYNEISY
jgi:hypothetical protein